MFGGVGPKLKGGLTRLQQSLGSGISYILKGPNQANLQISSGANGQLILTGSDSSGSGATSGSVNISGPSVEIAAGTGGSAAAGTISITGGSSFDGSAGAVSVIGGNGNPTSTPGAQALLKGGAAGSAVNAVGGNAVVEGGAGGNGGRGGHAVLRPGIGFGTPIRGHVWLDGGQGAALATSENGGFVLMPSMPGAPSGVPVNVPSGSVPMVIDTTNLRAYFYIAGTWRFTALT